jgi:hypothetical protein
MEMLKAVGTLKGREIGSSELKDFREQTWQHLEQRSKMARSYGVLDLPSFSINHLFFLTQRRGGQELVFLCASASLREF